LKIITPQSDRAAVTLRCDNFQAGERFRRLTLRFRLHPITAGQAATGFSQREKRCRQRLVKFSSFPSRRIRATIRL
jgi:hypothetical protein